MLNRRSLILVLFIFLNAAVLIAGSQEKIAIADFNEDGISDVAYQIRNGIFIQTGASLDKRINAGTISSLPDFLVSGDFNADGHFDLLAASRSGQLTWLFGNGHGSFDQSKEQIIGHKISGLYTTDLDQRDGLADVLIRLREKTIVLQSPEGASRAKSKMQNNFTIPIESRSLHLNNDAIVDEIVLDRDKVKAHLSQPSLTFTVTNNSDSGAGSLRQAIQDANGNSGPDQIHFAIPGSGVPTISILSALPTITDPVTIDSTTQSAGMVEIDGSLAGFVPAVLDITAGTSSVRGLVLNRITGTVIQISGTGGNLIRDNLIGTDPSGTVDLGNNGYAIDIIDSTNNIIGGTTSSDRNLISGNNGFSAIIIEGAASTGNQILGNYIGTDITGTIALGNSGNGIEIDSPNNTVGGAAAGSINIISGNIVGIRLSTVEATGNLIQGNYIGTDVSGLLDVGNGTGVSINANNNTVGGTTSILRNIISGNGSGIQITNCTDNFIQGNFIGTDVSGTASIANNAAGVIILAAANNTIGGSTTGAGNVISGNDFFGLVIAENTSSSNQVIQNFIGTQSDGVNPLGNGIHGIYFGNPAGTFANNNLIESNTIAFNSGDGIYGQVGTGNQLTSNIIFSNTGLGIDLGTDGVAANDSGDADNGANNLQNYPVLNSAVNSSGNIDIDGSLNSTASSSFTLEFFATVSCDPSGSGEAETFLGSTTVNTDATGNVSFNSSFPISIPSGQFITATATDSFGNTSEFSACKVIGTGACIFCDDFQDGDASDWTFVKGSWNVTNGDLTGTTNRKSDALSPNFGGCTTCTIQANLSIDTANGRASILGWFVDKRNLVEVRLMDDKDKVLLKQKIGGVTVAKGSSSQNISPATNYNLSISFNGTQFEVLLNGSSILTVPSSSSPSGNVGFRVKSISGSNVTARLSDIAVN
ncbi:FG-GAP-like repeat-containing protein [bacterium]|nr:FG-GAP-like repeat-containing protein [bacterium]